MCKAWGDRTSPASAETRGGGPGRSSRLPPKPLSPAVPELHSSQPRLVALRVGARRPPTPDAVQATFWARAGETPTRLLPSYRRPLPRGRASASAPCSCFPPPGGSGSLVHSTRGNHSHARGSSWDAEGTEADRPRRRGTFTHRRAGGDDLAAGADGWRSALTAPGPASCDAGWWRQRKTAGSRCCGTAPQLCRLPRLPRTLPAACQSSLQLAASPPSWSHVGCPTPYVIEPKPLTRRLPPPKHTHTRTRTRALSL